MISYKPLFKTMAMQNVTATDLINKAGINPNSMARFRTGKSVNTLTVDKICQYLHCEFYEVVDILPDKPEQPPQQS